MNRSKKITLKDGLVQRVTDGQCGLIVRCGCPTCGHGLLIWRGTYKGKCIWENKVVDLNHDYVDELESHFKTSEVKVKP